MYAGNMAGVFLILTGALVAVIGLRGTHAAVFGNLFQNTATSSDSTSGSNKNLPPIGPAIKPGPIGVLV